MQTASKQAKRKRDATLKLQKEQSKSDRKGKGRADREDLQVDEDFEQGDTQLAAVVAVGEGTRRRNKHHQVFDNDDQPEPSTSSAPRLDPALFQQAELALQQAKERALQEEREKREEEARVAEAALERQSSSRKRGSKRSRADGTATRIIG